MSGPGLIWNPFNGGIGFNPSGGPDLGGPAGGAGAGGSCAPGQWTAYSVTGPNPGDFPSICAVPPNGAVPTNGTWAGCFNSFPELLNAFPTAGECQTSPPTVPGGGGPEICPTGSVLQNGQCVPSPSPISSPGTCPSCGCVTCQCGDTSRAGKKCYQDPNRNYYWLGPNDEIPWNFEECKQIPQSIENTPQASPSQSLDNITCQSLVTYPWGSPDWCKCADQLRLAFEDWGASVLNVMSLETCDKGINEWNIICRAFVLMDLYKEQRQGSFAELAPIWLSNLRRLYKWVTNIYGDNSAALFGVYACRAAIECVLSLEGTISLSDAFTADIATGLHAVGMGVSSDSTQTGSGAFHISVKMKLDHTLKVLDQLIQYFVPTGVFSHSDALSLYYSNQLEDDGLKCMFSAAGIHPEWALPLAYSEREQPNAFEYVVAWRRGALTDQELSDSLRGRGWTEKDEQDLLVTISDFLPPPTDLVRFMLRNIGDEGIVQRFKLEAEFEQLFVGRIVDWAKAAGISEKVLRAYHAAHWDIPAPTWLATFWQRFGIDRTSPAALALPDRMTDQDYDRALREQGVSQFWRPFFKAAQYNVLGRRDLQWGYQFGALDEKAVRDGFLDNAFSPAQVDALVNTVKMRTVQAWSRDPVVRGYIKAGINERAVREYLSGYDVPDEVVNQVMTIVRSEAIELANEQALALLAKRFELGEFSQQALKDMLAKLELDPDQVARFVVRQVNLKAARGKQVPAFELCRFYGSRTITRQDFLLRLQTLGYTPSDSELIVSQCERDLSARQLRQEQLELKAQATAERRRIKDLSDAERKAQLAKNAAAKALASQIRAQRQADALLLREQTQEQTAADRAARRKQLAIDQAERQELQALASLEFIADHWAKRVGLDPVAVMTDLQDQVSTATGQGDVTVVELLGAIRHLLTISQLALPDSLSDLVALALAQVNQAGEQVPAPATSGSASNGQGPPALPIH
jgi:hypothetical protein